MTEPSSYDVVVVGGGVAGCYVAYRLLTAGPDDFAPDSPLLPILKRKGKLDVGLFDYSDRVGGRLRSVSVEEIPYLAEFGGFRFFHEQHIVWDLAQHLGLDDQPFAVDEPDNELYVRGKRLRQRDLNDPDRLPYNLPPNEQGMTASELSDLVNNTAVPGFSALRKRYYDALNAGDWKKADTLRREYQHRRDTATVDGRLLKDWSWWALKSRVLSQEAIDLLEDSGGYNTLASAGNTPTALDETFFFPDDIEWRHIKKGYAAIPTQLNAGFEQCGGATFKRHQLLRFDKAADGYELLFYKREGGELTAWNVAEQTCRTDPDRCVRVGARFLVLALPKRSLGLLDPTTFFLQNETVSGLIDTVFSVDAIRMFLAYDTPWWTQAGLSKGRSTTDLPLRQLYYWFTAPENSTDKSLLLASYSNGQAEEFWHSLQNGTAFPQQSDPPPRPATATMVELSQQQLKLIHGIDDIPAPSFARFQNWTRDPFGGAWHAWKTGNALNNDAYIVQIRQPLPSETIYIVGESWSNVQGWVQGALNSSEAMLQDNLGLTWPAWLTKEGTWLGPRK